MLVALDPEAYILQQGPMNPRAAGSGGTSALPGPQCRTFRACAAGGRAPLRPPRPPRSVEAAERLARWLHGEEQGSGK